MPSATLLVMKSTRVSWMAMHFSTVQMVPFFSNGNFNQLHKFPVKTGAAGILASSCSVPKASCSRVRGSDCQHSTLNCAVLDSLLGHSCHQEKSKLEYP